MPNFHTIAINPVGEPGCGKSTLSMWLCQGLKLRGVSTEFVPEVIKYETFNPQSIARVVSGRFDQRFLRRQHALALPLVGQVEVIVNDGSLESFLYYSQRRMPADRLSAMREQIERYRKQMQPCEQRFVTVSRNHPYETTGRRQDEEEAISMRHDILDVLRQEFGVVPILLSTQEDRENYLTTIVNEVAAKRLLISAEVKLQSQALRSV